VIRSRSSNLKSDASWWGFFVHMNVHTYVHIYAHMYVHIPVCTNAETKWNGGKLVAASGWPDWANFRRLRSFWKFWKRHKLLHTAEKEAQTWVTFQKVSKENYRPIENNYFGDKNPM
jgi:hypothetical protein